MELQRPMFWRMPFPKPDFKTLLLDEMGKLHTLSVTLRRTSRNHPWGISLVGGSDVGTPLIITRVSAGSPGDGQVFRGDIITKIGEYDSRDIRHEDAENLFRNAENSIKIYIQRDSSVPRQAAVAAGSAASSRCSSALPPLSPLALSPNPALLGAGLASPNVPHRSPSPAHSYKETLQQPLDNLPHTIFPTMDGNEMFLKTVPDLNTANLKKSAEHEQELEAVTNQPYRTTPLVLPGAKVKHEPAPTESYLRHHPNPSMRHSHGFDHEVLMKQRVADSMLHKVVGDDATVGGRQVVHKQFNSPIGLYSESNIVDTIKNQTGIHGVKRNPVFDPSRSETYKALQEEQYDGPVHEVSVPVTTKVFTPQHHPNRVPPARKPAPIPQVIVNNQPNPYANAFGETGDQIHQSGSFKRLMHTVLGQTDY